MSETRFINEYKDGILVKQIPYIVTDEQLTEEAEVKALTKVDTLIDSITSLAEAKVFLKRLCARLIKKGYLL